VENPMISAFSLATQAGSTAIQQIGNLRYDGDEMRLW